MKRQPQVIKWVQINSKLKIKITYVEQEMFLHLETNSFLEGITVQTETITGKIYEILNCSRE